MTEYNLIIDPLPAKWCTLPFDKICSRVKDNYQPQENGTKTYVGLEHIQQRFPSFTGKGIETQIRSSKTAFQNNDLLFGKLRPYLRKAVLADCDGICSTDILVFRANENTLPSYLCYLAHTDNLVNHAKATTSGVQHPRTSWPSLRKFQLSLPPLPEQKKIAHILSMVQRGIEQQERLIQVTTELKKTLMQKFFTEGLHNEQQKQTEIGLVPESWDVVPLGELVMATQYGLSVKGNADGNHPILRMTNQINGRISSDNLQHVQIEQDIFEKFRVDKEDILFNRTNSFELVGRTSIFDLDDDFVFASYLIRVKTDKQKLNPFFLNDYFNTDETQLRLKSIATRAVSQSNISATRLNTFVVPLPGKDEQQTIVDKLEIFSRKIANYSKKKRLLEDLFRTLLHKLMTAQIRVDEIEFDGLSLSE